MGVYIEEHAPVVSMKKFRDDPVANKLDTPSGKIEIFSEKLLEFTEGWELEADDTLPGLDTMPPDPRVPARVVRRGEHDRRVPARAVRLPLPRPHP
ncbi:MAG: hypothetical protein V8S24_01295 [Gordonibacter pamelaeae]